MLKCRYTVTATRLHINLTKNLLCYPDQHSKASIQETAAAIVTPRHCFCSMSLSCETSCRAVVEVESPVPLHCQAEVSCFSNKGLVQKKDTPGTL